MSKKNNLNYLIGLVYRLVKLIGLKKNLYWGNFNIVYSIRDYNWPLNKIVCFN